MILIQQTVGPWCVRVYVIVLLDVSLFPWYQLGLGRGHGQRYVQEPSKVVGGLTEVTQIASGDFHCCAVTRSGAVYSWGMGRDGQLGHGEKTDQPIPTAIEAFKDREIRQVPSFSSPPSNERQQIERDARNSVQTKTQLTSVLGPNCVSLVLSSPLRYAAEAVTVLR